MHRRTSTTAKQKGQIALAFVAITAGAAFTHIGAAASASVTPGVPPAGAMLKSGESDAAERFRAAVAEEIDHVVKSDPPRFVLAPYRNAGFAFYENGLLEAVRCERAVNFSLVVGEGTAGDLLVGVCTGAAARRIQNAVISAPAALSAALYTIEHVARARRKESSSTGWKYEKEGGPEGSEIHSFPIIWFGHGFGLIRSTVLVTRTGQETIVVQADLDGMCAGRMRNRTPLCTETTAAMGKMAKRLFARFREQL